MVYLSYSLTGPWLHCVSYLTKPFLPFKYKVKEVISIERTIEKQCMVVIKFKINFTFLCKF